MRMPVSREQLKSYVRYHLEKDGYVIVDHFFGAEFDELKQNLIMEKRTAGDALHDTCNLSSLWSFRENDTIKQYFQMAYGDTRMVCCRSPLVQCEQVGAARSIFKGRAFFIMEETTDDERLSMYVSKMHRNSARYSSICMLSGKRFHVTIVRGSHLVHKKLFTFVGQHTQKKGLLNCVSAETMWEFVKQSDDIEILTLEMKEGSVLFYDRRVAYCRNRVIPKKNQARKPPNRTHQKKQERKREKSAPITTNEELFFFPLCYTPYKHLKAKVINNGIKSVFFNSSTDSYGRSLKRAGASGLLFSVSPRGSQGPCVVEDCIIRYLCLLFPPLLSDSSIGELCGVGYFQGNHAPSSLVRKLFAAYEKYNRANDTISFVSEILRLRNQRKKDGYSFNRLLGGKRTHPPDECAGNEKKVKRKC